MHICYMQTLWTSSKGICEYCLVVHCDSRLLKRNKHRNRDNLNFVQTLLQLLNYSSLCRHNIAKKISLIQIIAVCKALLS